MYRLFQQPRDSRAAEDLLRSANADQRDPASFAPTILRDVDPIALLIAFGIVLLAWIAIGTAMMVTHFRERAMVNTERELSNTALLLSRHLDQEFEQLALVQNSLIDRIHFAGILSGDDFERKMSGRDTHLMLKEKIAALRHIAGVGLAGPDGKLLNTSRVWPFAPVDMSDRDVFKALQSNPHATFLVTEPVKNRADGRLTVVLARRINAPDGSFLGASVLGPLEPGYFQKFFASLALGEDSTVSLFRSDGMLLARYPEIESAIGKTFPLLVDKLGDADARTGRSAASADGIDRVMAARRLAKAPLTVVVGIDSNAALADWRDQTRFLLGVAGFSVILIAAILFLVVRKLLKSHKRSEHRYALEKRRLDTAIDNMSQGLLMFDETGRIVIVNQRYIDMYGVSPDVVKPGCTFRGLLQHRKDVGSFSGDVDEYCSMIRESLAKGKASQLIGDTSDGRSIKIANNPMEGGGWVATLEDITRQRDAERERERDREFLHQIIDNIPMTIFVKEVRDRRYVLVNNAGAKYLGASKEEIVGKTAHEIHSRAVAESIADQDEQLLQSDGHVIVDEYTIDTAGMGTRFFTSVRVTIFDENENPQYLVSVVNDITERKQADARIAHLAHHDSLTDLPNRALFRKQLEHSLTSACPGHNVAVLYLDLDNFKEVNDSLGHPTGDALLKAIAERLRGCLGESDTVARLGGDEFAIIQTDVAHATDVTDLVRKIHETIREPYYIGSHHLTSDASIGISMAPRDDTDPDQLLKNADLALYVAKSEGRSTYRFFEPAMDARMKARRELEADLRQSILSGGFELYYQPLINLADDKITSCEALLRWRHPNRGMVLPMEFIPIAEETGLITSLGEWVLRTACAEAMNWPADIKVAVNVSPVQFRSQTLPLTIIGALAACGLPANRLVLEITEAVLIRDDEIALAMLHQVRELGVQVAMDDFGTGYSSLSYLRRFPFDKIKIDRSFIKDIGSEGSSPAIVQAVVDIARSRDITTTAEGVETIEQLEFLRALGCTEMQGHLFSPPVPAPEILKFFRPYEQMTVDAL